jgi:hypothetical protein
MSQKYDWKSIEKAINKYQLTKYIQDLDLFRNFVKNKMKLLN